MAIEHFVAESEPIAMLRCVSKDSKAKNAVKKTQLSVNIVMDATGNLKHIIIIIIIIITIIIIIIITIIIIPSVLPFERECHRKL
jgi:hypothetical protein